MRKVLLIFLLVIFFTLPLFAQQVDTAWVRRYNGPGNGVDEACAIVVDVSGNVYVTGTSYDSVTSDDYATIKYYPNGDTAWVRRYDRPGSGGDVAKAIAIDGLGNVYVTGNPGGDYVTVKYYPNGDTAWVRMYNGPGNANDGPSAITVDASGNVCVTGYSEGNWTYNDYLTIKYYPNGDTAWTRRYDGPGNSHDLAAAIATDSSGNVYVTGRSFGSGTGYDFATIKYLPNGNTAWVRRYNGPGDLHDVANAIAIDDSGNVYVTGMSGGIGGDYATIKYSPSGTELWVRRYNGPGNYRDEAFVVAVDDSGNVYVTGESPQNTYPSPNCDYATLKYDKAGNELWVQRYNGPGNSDDNAFGMALDKSGNIYVAGRSAQSIYPYPNFDFAIVKYDASGNEVWVKRYNGPGNDDDEANAIAVDGCGNVYVTGTSYDIGMGQVYATIKYWQNYPPNVFSLVSPLDSSIIPCVVDSDYIVTFDWAIAIDPDPCDTVTYDLYLSISSNFYPDSTIIYDNLSNNEYTDTLGIGRYYWKIRAYDKRSEIWSNQTWTFLSSKLGDVNADKQVTVTDVVYLINYLFKGGPAPIPELLAGNVNGDGKVTVADVVYLINYLFKGGPPPGC